MCVVQVFARVSLESPTRAELGIRAEPAPGEAQRCVQVFGNTENLNLHVSLSAQDSEGRRIDTAGPDFGMSGPRRGVWHRWHGPSLPEDRDHAQRLALTEHHVDRHDIEDGINQMLGRDPTLHRPPRLSWGNLVTALREAGLAVTEQELIAAPMTIELSDDVARELGEFRERRT